MKLELYKVYKTRAGHKAVVVEGPHDNNGYFRVYHVSKSGTWLHEPDGEAKDKLGYDDYSIVCEWGDQRTGELWVNVYDTSPLVGICFLSKEHTDLHNLGSSTKRIAVKRVRWTEGDEE